MNAPDHGSRNLISFIVPAHNEECCLPRTLDAIEQSAKTLGHAYELIVVNDASTDNTAEIALRHRAIRVDVQHRQIAKTRNSGGRAANGYRLFFVDADTIVTPSALRSALRVMDKGAAGGGSHTRFEGPVPLYAHLLLLWFGVLMRIAGLSGGAFMFCTREAFHAVGGFDERLYGAEDAAMSSTLKGQGPFVIISERLLTSGRRVRAMSGLKLLGSLCRIAFAPNKMLTQRSNVQEIWYESNRARDEHVSPSLLDRFSNGIALIIMIFLITLPIWVVPWPESLLNTPLRHVKAIATIILSHIALVLWPCGFFLARCLLRQPRWPERLKLTVITSFAFVVAMRASFRVCEIWFNAVHRLL